MYKNWKDLLLNRNGTMRDAIEVLENKKHGIVIIVDDQGRLQGTITDGDIRRALMKQNTLDTPLVDIYKENPVTIFHDDTISEIAEKMKSEAINQAPIVDANHVVIGIEDRSDFGFVKYDNPVFLMAGGFGKRLMPLTKSTPKPMLKVGEKPILEIILQEFIKLGFWNFYA